MWDVTPGTAEIGLGILAAHPIPQSLTEQNNLLTKTNYHTAHSTAQICAIQLK